MVDSVQLCILDIKPSLQITYIIANRRAYAVLLGALVEGWAIFNTYPERATAAKNISEYDKKLSDENIKVIKEFLQKNKIKEVFGAWGDLKYKPLQEGKNKLVAMLADINVEIFYFGTLTKQGNPRHPLQRYEKIEVEEDKKQYLKSL
jgi:hypothetical protein